MIKIYFLNEQLGYLCPLLQMIGVGRVAGVRGLATMFQGKLLAAEILAEVICHNFRVIS